MDTRARVGARVPLVVVTLLLTLLILRRFARPGLVLVRDLVFVPSPAWRLDLIGVSTAPPRAVPSGLWETVLSHGVGAELAERLTLVLILCAAAFGTALVARVVGESDGRSQAIVVAGACAALLNPFVAERLLIGQWVVLVGYAAIGWSFWAACRLGTRGVAWSGWPALATGVLAGSIGGAQAWILLVPVVLIAVLVGHSAGRAMRDRITRLAVAVAILTGATLPWALPSLVRTGGGLSRSTHSELFAVRSDTVLGTVGSVLTGGGIWNGDAVPAGRSSVPSALLGLVVLAVAAVGAVSMVRRRDRMLPGLGWVGAVGVAVPLLSMTALYARVVDAVPGGGLLRDAQRFAALWVFVVAVLFARGIGWLWSRRDAAGILSAVVGVVALAAGSTPLLTGRAIEAHPTDFPRDYAIVRAELSRAGADDAVVVLPWGGYRSYGWNGGVPSAEPLPRMLSRRVVTSAALTVRVGGRDVTAADDDPVNRRVGDILLADLSAQQRTDALAAQGVGWVLVDAANPGESLQSALSSVRVQIVYAGRWLVLARLDPTVAVSAPSGSSAPRWAGWVGLAGWLAAWTSCGVAAIVRARRRRVVPRSPRRSASS